jgi:LacI family transcriptional regulator
MGDTNDELRRRITIVDVAKHAGVSTASASKVLRNAYGASESMRARVQASMDELGYRPHGPARGMRGRTFTIGVVVSDIENPFFGLVTEGLSSVIRPKSYELFISPSGFDASPQKSVVEAMIDHQVDGLVLVAPLIPIAELERIAARVPLAIVGLHSRSTAFDTVSSDDEHGAQLVVEHLVTLGHRRIAFVMHSLGRGDETRPEFRRLAGFERAMRTHGLADEAIVLDASWSLDGGYEAARQINLLEPAPTAVFAGADIAALGIMNELCDRAMSAPYAFSLVGYDNSHMSSLGPISLTTVDQSGFGMGKRVGQLLLERIEGRREACHEIFEPRLVERHSTAQPTKSGT